MKITFSVYLLHKGHRLDLGKLSTKKQRERRNMEIARGKCKGHRPGLGKLRTKKQRECRNMEIA
jgi:hypothetical protein